MLKLLTPRDISLAIDLGTRNILISDQQRILFRQQTVAAFSVSDETRKTIIVGEQAEQIFEKRLSQYHIIRPLSRGVISDFENCKLFLKYALNKVTHKFLIKPGILISCPLDVTAIEKVAFREVLNELGFHKVELVFEPTAAVAGLVERFHKKKGILVVDVGAGITEAVVFSMGDVVCHASIRIGGEDFEQAIISFVRKRFNFQIGIPVAQFLLSVIGQNQPDSYLHPIDLRGVSIQRRSPGILKLEMLEVIHALDDYFRLVSSLVQRVLEVAPEELSSDIMEQGIHLTGGASQFHGLVETLQFETGLNVCRDTQPLLGVARGEIALLQNANIRKYCIDR